MSVCISLTASPAATIHDCHTRLQGRFSIGYWATCIIPYALYSHLCLSPLLPLLSQRKSSPLFPSMQEAAAAPHRPARMVHVSQAVGLSHHFGSRPG
jgi:hypothetical protein